VASEGRGRERLVACRSDRSRASAPDRGRVGDSIRGSADRRPREPSDPWPGDAPRLPSRPSGCRAERADRAQGDGADHRHGPVRAPRPARVFGRPCSCDRRRPHALRGLGRSGRPRPPQPPRAAPCPRPGPVGDLRLGPLRQRGRIPEGPRSRSHRDRRRGDLAGAFPERRSCAALPQKGSAHRGLEEPPDPDDRARRRDRLVPAGFVRRRRDHTGRQLPDPLEGACYQHLARPGDPLPDDDVPHPLRDPRVSVGADVSGSHGCVRVPIWLADWLYLQSPVGEPVYVYE
jgi:hypothetical protein